MNHQEVNDNLIFLTQVGSQAYGTNIPGVSDEDLGGIAIPPKEYFIGDKHFEQSNKWTDAEGNKIDKTIYNFNKAIDLMLDANPNMIDMLFMPERSIKFIRPEWERILAIRESFISKKAKHSFIGYAHAQMERIETHKSYLRSPVERPSRIDFDLNETSIFPETQYEVIAKISTDYVPEELRKDFYRSMSSLIDNEGTTLFRQFMEPGMVQIAMGEFKKGQKEFLSMLSSISGKFLKDEFTDAAKNELRYLQAYKNWKRYQDWDKGRNPKRKAMEAKCGYDSKFAMHALRLLSVGIEILEGKGVQVDRTGIDAPYLLEVRNGNIPWDEVLGKSRKSMDRLEELYESSTIPYAPNRDLINSVRMDIIEKYAFGNPILRKIRKAFSKKYLGD